ncbi:MAG: hypothetical protein IKF38_01900 [Clostridia bacterium]|nr:hypothetical protein [Clostridia bacterium]
MEKIWSEIKNNREFIEIVEPLLKNEMVQEMKKYRQHYETSCYDHCLEASYYCYKICKKHNWDYVSCAKAAMVHDLFLYDWRKRQPDRKGLHAFTHPKTAYENACKIMELNDKQKDIILKHMWPLTVIPPRYKESFLLTLVDKYCALSESWNEIKKKHSRKH